VTKVVLPRLNQTGANEWADVQTNDEAITQVVNGELNNENLSGSAGIIDANLANPNNSAYRTILQAKSNINENASSGGTKLMLGSVSGLSPGAGGPGGGALKSGNSMSEWESSVNQITLPPDVFYFAAADYAVNGKTSKLRVSGMILPNATAPGINFTFGMYPLTSAGAEKQLALTLGTVVSGSTAAVTTPSASTPKREVSGDFTIPADGFYALGVVISSNLTAKSIVLASAHLQVRAV
jgi:hypothetical protein